MSLHGTALDNLAWRQAGCPRQETTTCPTCGQVWTERVTTFPGEGRDSDPWVRRELVEGSRCDCREKSEAAALAARHAEQDAFAAQQAAKEAAKKAEWDALPVASPGMPGRWSDGGWPPKFLTARQVIEAALWRGNPVVKVRPDGGLWADWRAGWYHPA